MEQSKSFAPTTCSLVPIVAGTALKVTTGNVVGAGAQIAGQKTNLHGGHGVAGMLLTPQAVREVDTVPREVPVLAARAWLGPLLRQRDFIEQRGRPSLATRCMTMLALWGL